MLKNPSLHKNLLLQILKAIYTDTTLGPALGFKGGTAAMLFYGLDRLSVDLDFDLLNAAEEDRVFEKVGLLLKPFGTIKERYKKHHTLFFMLSYSGQAHNIKIEISRRAYEAHYSLQNYLGISMLVMEREDMAACKLMALLERKKTANRDLYDLWFFLKNHWEINEAMIEKQSGLSLKKYLKKAADFVKKYNDEYILQGIGELLDEKQKAWVKANLKKDLLFLLQLRLESEKGLIQ